MPARRIDVAILGATGAVGQRLVQLLDGHPWFQISTVMASDRSAGRPYSQAAHWLLPGGMPPQVAAMDVLSAAPENSPCELVFSALDAEPARKIEPAFRDAGRVVVSNARSFRQSAEVPLVIPEVNPDHLELVRNQRQRFGGAIATNPNCSTIGLCLSLDPLRRSFGVSEAVVTTLQATSGAGYPGVASLDLVDNVLPEISGEEDKLENEPRKIFGSLRSGRIEAAELSVSAQCNRVPVRDGHLLSVSVRLARRASMDDVRQAFLSYRSPLTDLQLPSAPEQPVIVVEDFARPQPVLDRDRAGGMAVTLGRLQECPVLDLRYVALVHNTIRGAAGGTLLIAELLHAEGLFD